MHYSNATIDATFEAVFLIFETITSKIALLYSK